MKLTDEMKEQLKNAETKEQAKDMLEKAGIELSDDELDDVSGGLMPIHKNPKII